MNAVVPKAESDVAQPEPHQRPAHFDRICAAEALKKNTEAAGQKLLLAQVRAINEIGTIRALSLEFSVHEATGRMLVRVTDRNTNELVRQFPAERLLSVAECLRNGGSLHELLAG